MKTLLLGILLTTSIAYSQDIGKVETFSSISGQPFFPRQYENVNGSPFLFEDWAVSTITLTDGRKLRDIKANFNLVTEELVYVDERGKEMVASPTVIKSVETLSGSIRKFVTTPAKNTYYEVISSEGKATLLRHAKKVILETKPFNSATIQKNFISNESVMVSLGGNITEIKSANDIYSVLTPAEPLKEFAKKEKLKQRSVDSWVKIVDHYNAIETRIEK